MRNNTNIIERVDEKTAAETGLRGNDKIVQIDSKDVKTKGDIDYLLLSRNPNTNEYTKKTSVKLRIERNGKEENIDQDVPVK